MLSGTYSTGEAMHFRRTLDRRDIEHQRWRPLTSQQNNVGSRQIVFSLYHSTPLHTIISHRIISLLFITKLCPTFCFFGSSSIQHQSVSILLQKFLRFLSTSTSTTVSNDWSVQGNIRKRHTFRCAIID